MPTKKKTPSKRPLKKTASKKTKTPSRKFGMGLIPDRHDDRDFKYAHVAGTLQALAGIKAIPKKVDLRRMMSPIRNQGSIGSCTAFATAVGLMESTQIELQGELSLPLSPLFLYYATRERARQVNQDAGASLRDVIKTAAEVGVCAESEWPYDTTKWAVKPPQSAYDANDKLVVSNYYRVANLAEMRQSLASTNPVVFGLMLYDSFEMVGADGKVPVPNTDKENLLGGHALLAVGYNDRDKVIIVRNSWGEDWGDKGYCYIPYDYMSDRHLCIDMWTCTFTLGSN